MRRDGRVADLARWRVDSFHNGAALPLRIVLLLVLLLLPLFPLLVPLFLPLFPSTVRLEVI